MGDNPWLQMQEQGMSPPPMMPQDMPPPEMMMPPPPQQQPHPSEMFQELMMRNMMGFNPTDNGVVAPPQIGGVPSMLRETLFDRGIKEKITIERDFKEPKNPTANELNGGIFENPMSPPPPQQGY